ncbi:MAG: ABC transporter ATP-binding protein [Anaerolineae bacterium]|nr:ABC transporter ATP-binding protein [Anaerolineae bacterium]
MTILLEANHAGKTFTTGGFFKRSEAYALRDFSLAIDDEKPIVTAIAGESGSGKTTLARLLLGVIAPSIGTVRYKGVDVHTMKRDQWREFRQDVQAIYQDPFEVYNPFYRVDHVLTTPVAKFKLARNAAEAQELIESTLNKVGLRPEETLGRYPHQLSGGQRQRIMIARALLLRPKIIIADEPVSMVDASLRATILESLLKLHEEFGISLIYITHDLTTAYQLCRDINILYRGAVVETGDVEQVIKQPQHPYTQLLVGSIPLPDPNRRWGDETVDQARRADVPDTGCLFADRCPWLMPACQNAPPPLYQTSPARATACYVYEDEAKATTKSEAEAVLSGEVS